MNSYDNIVLSVLHSAGVTHKDFIKLFAKNLSIDEIFQKIISWNQNIRAIFPEKRFLKIVDKIAKIDINFQKNFLESQNIRIISIFDDDYPEFLKNIFNIPQILYVQGDISLRSMRIAVVGSRKHTHYGKAALEKIMSEFTTDDISIISGGAYGIDSLAHEIAIAKNMHTIAVFGTGINVSYPSTNRGLFAKILSSGWGIISIFPIDTTPEAYNFPIRNEIVAGLADAVLIPEAGLKSGTLITAKLALDLWKDVYAVPGDIFKESSQGTNMLIARSEAYPIISGDIIFSDWNMHYALKKDTIHDDIIPKQTQIWTKNIINSHQKTFSSELQKNIFELISSGINTPDSIILELKIPIETVTLELTLLELDGHISVDDFGNYQII